MASRDSIRVEPKQKNNPKAGVRYIRHNEPDELTCLPEKNKYQELLQGNPGLLLSTGEGGTAL